MYVYIIIEQKIISIRNLKDFDNISVDGEPRFIKDFLNDFFILDYFIPFLLLLLFDDSLRHGHFQTILNIEQ